jgi:nitrate/nitrite-specific signal transduction histidine kinase
MTTKKLTWTYVIALSIIALILIFSHTMVRYNIEGQKDDGTIINVAGRQRMLSQRIAKLALRLQIRQNMNKNLPVFKKSLEEFKDAHLSLTNAGGS